MNLTDYHLYTQALTDHLSGDARVEGLIALGSMANQPFQPPDEWSDHDFYVIVQTGTQAQFRQNFDWLPRLDPPLFGYQETEHGCKVLLQSGHLLEFAIFDRDELKISVSGVYRMLLDRGGIEAIIRPTIVSERAYRGDMFYAGQFLAHLWVGTMRYRRGEQVSGRVFIQHYGIDDLLNLLAHHLPPEQPIRLDMLDPLRRFEKAYPTIGAEVNAALNLPLPESAVALLGIFETHLRDKLVDYPSAAVITLRGCWRASIH